MPDRSELMLILGADRSVDAPPGLYRVTQKVSSRVVIVESGDTAKEELQAMDGVDAVLEPGERPAGHIRGTLTETEALFVDAYSHRARPKERLGDGLNWDAEGFLPPDPPPKR